ncbi:hypothetical protein [Henriciella aquimarina]|uniref:hypothetical protein n=1 Tax=Henriciella aquimarina TaxID=545261 RepID=UPI0009FC2ADF|nr:hypothetical protein [Henriciella aquimarina]
MPPSPDPEEDIRQALMETGIYTAATSTPAPVVSAELLKWLITSPHIPHPVCRIEGVVFRDPVNLCAYRSEKHVHLIGCRFLGELDLRHLRLPQLILDRSCFEAPVKMNGAQIERGMLANKAEFENLTVQAAEFGGNLELSDTKFRTELKAYQVNVAKSLFIRDGTELKGANLAGAKVGTNFQLRGTKLAGMIDLTGADINGELQFSNPESPPISWAEDASLSLRNVRARAFGARLRDFQRGAEYVPLDLSGLTFEEFGGVNLKDNSSIAHEKPEALLTWLEQSSSKASKFDPKPFITVADALARTGQLEAAQKLKIGLEWQETYKADMSPISRSGRFLSGWFVGFGYAPWRALWLFGGLFLLGFAYAYFVQTGFSLVWAGMGATIDAVRLSLENSIPLIEFTAPLGRQNCPEALDAGCISLSSTSLLLFDVQKVLSLILGSYFVAAISGFASTRRH